MRKRTKKILAIAAGIIVIGGIAEAAGGGSTDSSTAASSAVTVAEAPEETNLATDTATESATESVNIDDLQPTYYKRVNDDKTGNWRVITFLASNSGEEDIVPLYNHYKTSDQEIFYMINLWTDVTYCVRNVGKNMISVTPTEHVDGEEATAKLLGSGTSMGDDVFYDTTTGEQINF